MRHLDRTKKFNTRVKERCCHFARNLFVLKFLFLFLLINELLKISTPKEFRGR